MEKFALYTTKQRAHYVAGNELCLFTIEGGRVVMTWNRKCEFLHFPRGMGMNTAIAAVLQHGGPTKYADWIHTNDR